MRRLSPQLIPTARTAQAVAKPEARTSQDVWPAATDSSAALTRPPRVALSGLILTGHLVTDRVGRIHIRRVDIAYYVMFVPAGHGKPCLFGEDNLRAFLVAANVLADRIEDAAIALRRGTEYEIPNVRLSLDRMIKLSL